MEVADYCRCGGEFTPAGDIHNTKESREIDVVSYKLSKNRHIPRGLRRTHSDGSRGHLPSGIGDTGQGV